ncbi:MAG: MBL fold metallo-hydrolase [Roseburia sp.]|nr:MBL fold metallo-hydrolase [Roseburia sp.]
MKVLKFQPQGYECNVFAVSGDGVNCILIDCGDGRVSDKVKAAGLTPRAVLLTHGHFDHIAGCAALQSAGADIYCGEGEEDFLFSQANRSVFGLEIPQFKVKKTFKDGEEIELCGVKIKVIATPGHTAGGVSYLIGDSLFTGDTLFYGSIGRSDFPTGNAETLVNSVKKLYGLKGDYKVYCGHGEDTTLERERRFNAFVRA